METNWLRRYALLAVLLLALLWSVWQTGRWISGGVALKTDITQLVPSGGMDPVTERLYRELIETTGSRLLVVVEASKPGKVEAAAIALQDRLTTTEGVQHVDARPDPERPQMLADALSPYRDGLLSSDDRAALLSDPETAARKWTAQDPFFRLLPIDNDPLGTLERFLIEALPTPGNIESDGFFYWLERDANENYAIVVFSELSPEGVGTDRGDRLDGLLGELFEAIRNEYGVQVHASSAVFHASASKRQAQWETTSFGMVSAVLIAALIIYAFMSLAPVITMITVIGVAVLTGLSVAIWLFGEIHVLTLVMALPVIGITVDYVIHSLVNRGMENGAGTHAGLPPYLLRALCWSCFSSALGFAALGGVDIAVLRQVAVVLVTGLVAALLWTIALVHAWAKNPSSSRIRRLSETPWIVRVSEGMEVGRRELLWMCMAMLFVLAAVWGFGAVDVVNDPNALRYVEPKQVRHDRRVQQWLGLSGSGRSLVIHGADGQQVLQRQEQLIDGLQEQFGVSATGLSSLAPSLMRQGSNRQLVSQAYVSLSERQGVRAGMKVTSDPNGELLPGDLPDSVLKLLPPFDLVPERADPWASTTLAEAVDWPAISAWCDAQPGCRTVDSIAALAGGLGTMHRVARGALYAAVALISLVLLVRYRDRGIWAGAALVLVMLSGHVVPGVLGMPLTLFTTGGLFILLGLSVDYLFFIAEASPRRQYTWLAFALTVTTTLLAFGVLLFSLTPAVRMLVAPVVVGLPVMLLILFFLQSRLAPSAS
jgi:predicted exporter